MILFRDAAPSRLLQELILFRNVSSSAATTKIYLIYRQCGSTATITRPDSIPRRWLHCGYYKNWYLYPTEAPMRPFTCRLPILIRRRWLQCGHYLNWSCSPAMEPLQLLQKLILFADGGSTATITWTDPEARQWSRCSYYKNWSYSAAAITKTDPIRRRWLHCDHYLNWSWSPAMEPLQLLQKLILFADGGSTATITWTDPEARQWSRCGQSWWAGSCRRVSRYPINKARSAVLRTWAATLQQKKLSLAKIPEVGKSIMQIDNRWMPIEYWFEYKSIFSKK